jgi:hypothetical protein
MRRRTLDFLLTSAGLLLALVLLVAGGLLTWGHVFVTDQVHDQLSQQQIYFPAKGSAAISDPAIAPYLDKYAGQQLVSGAQAEAYADHFIAVHLVTIGAGKTYAQLSAASQAAPTNAALTAQVAEVFKGQTLRGLLLNAYAFGKMAQIALYAAIAAFIGAAVMVLLTGLGLLHGRRADPAAEVFPEVGRHAQPPTVAVAAAKS